MYIFNKSIGVNINNDSPEKILAALNDSRVSNSARIGLTKSGKVIVSRHWTVQSGLHELRAERFAEKNAKDFITRGSYPEGSVGHWRQALVMMTKDTPVERGPRPQLSDQNRYNPMLEPLQTKQPAVPYAKQTAESGGSASQGAAVLAKSGLRARLSPNRNAEKPAGSPAVAPQPDQVPVKPKGLRRTPQDVPAQKGLRRTPQDVPADQPATARWELPRIKMGGVEYAQIQKKTKP